MRIVQLLETLEVGGMERIAVDLALAQKAAGHQTAVYCLLGAGVLRGELDRAKIPVVEFHKERRAKAAVIWSIAAQLRRDRPHVLHGHNPGVHHFGAVAARLAGVPVCVNTRHSATTSTGAPYQERYYRWVQPLTSHVVFVCDYVRCQLQPRLRYPAKKCSVIINGIPLDRFLANPASPGGALPRIRFGTIGRLVPAKGHSVLIDAFSRVAGRLPHAGLRIFGYGPLESELRQQIQRLGMSDRITLEGPARDSAQALRDLDIFVFSSLNEGLPVVILEAMAAGLPIVSTRVGGVPEVAPESLFPWFCPPASAPGLADAMLRAAGSDRLAAIGAEARRVASQNYGIVPMCRQYEAVYDRFLSARDMDDRERRLFGRK
jgi:glycosyltransferase involved in cell wall biosynthesis